MPGKITKPNAENWYMDGSGMKNHFGAGVNGPRDNSREIFLWTASLQCFKLK